MTGLKLELFSGALVVALVGAATVVFAAADVEENFVAMGGVDSGADKFETGVTTVLDNLASPNENMVSPRIRSLPVPLMERRALKTTTDDARERVRGVAKIRKKRTTHGQRHHHDHRFDEREKNDTRGSEGSLSAYSVRHSLCEQIEISASHLRASETTRSSHPPENVIDGDLDTHWVTEGLASWLMVDLPETIALQGVAVAFGENSDGSRDDSQSFTMLVLGDNEVIHRPELNAGATRGLEYLGFEREILARSVVLVGYGREGHTSLAELKLCRAPASSLKEHAEGAASHQRTDRRARRNLRGSRTP